MTILFCTVGGSHRPIIKAIEHYGPDKIYFVCSQDDEVTGRPGSYTTIEKSGKVISSQPGGKADLPNIPTQLELEAGSWEVVKVPADDPSVVMSATAERMRREESARIIADYTGGTKSMSVGLFLAALQFDGVELSQVSGPRVDLVRVSDGYEAARGVDVDAVRQRWLLEQARSAWHRFAYSEANELLSAAGSTSSEVQRILILGRGFAAWDCFDHQRAYELLRPLAGQLPRGLMPALAKLHAPEPNSDSDALKIWDLSLMAHRREAQHNFDVAVLVLYRVVEWVAQWTLRWLHELDAGDLPPEVAERFPDLVHTSRKEKLVVGLFDAWRLIGRLDGPLAEKARELERELLGFTERRNSSIFAHGVQPVSKADLQEARRWAEAAVLAPFRDQAFKGAEPYPQLPDDFARSER